MANLEASLPPCRNEPKVSESLGSELQNPSLKLHSICCNGHKTAKNRVKRKIRQSLTATIACQKKTDLLPGSATSTHKHLWSLKNCDVVGHHVHLPQSGTQRLPTPQPNSEMNQPSMCLKVWEPMSSCGLSSFSHSNIFELHLLISAILFRQNQINKNCIADVC